LKKIIAVAAAFLVLALVPAAAQTPGNVPNVAPNVAEPGVGIEVRAQPIETFEPRDAARTRFGELEFRGGLILTSPNKRFGGLSAIRVEPDGERFLALSDRGHWFRGRIVYRAGRPAGLADVVTAPILGPDGRPLAARGWFDTESLAIDNGTVYVGIERVNQIVRFNYGKDGLGARGQPIAVPPEVRALPFNKGLECLVVPPKGLPHAGTLIAISERGLDAQGNLRAFLIGGQNPGIFAVRRTDDFDVSDCTTTPRGDLLILERRFSWALGVAMRIRRLALSELRPGALLDGPELIFADMGYQIDNMEGISVHRSATGELVLTLVSDDNFSPIQRNVLLQFTLVGE
jgi:hypothetical protein